MPTQIKRGPSPTEWNAWRWDDDRPDDPVWIGSAPTEAEAVQLLPKVRGYPRGQVQQGIGGKVVNY